MIVLLSVLDPYILPMCPSRPNTFMSYTLANRHCVAKGDTSRRTNCEYFEILIN
jgi:hypothetical protein